MEGIRVDECLFANSKPNTNMFLGLIHLGDGSFAKGLVLHLRTFIYLRSVKFNLGLLRHNDCRSATR